MNISLRLGLFILTLFAATPAFAAQSPVTELADDLFETNKNVSGVISGKEDVVLLKLKNEPTDDESLTICAAAAQHGFVIVHKYIESQKEHLEYVNMCP